MGRMVFVMAGLLAVSLSAPGIGAAATPLAAEVAVRGADEKVMVQAVVRVLATEEVVFAPQVVTRKGADARAETGESGGDAGWRGLLLVEFSAGSVHVPVEVNEGTALIYRGRFSSPVP